MSRLDAADLSAADLIVADETARADSDRADVDRADVDRAPLGAHQDERFIDAGPRVGLLGRGRFLALLALALLIHAAIIAAFLWRDAHEPLQVASAEETPVEVIVEPPPKPEPLPKPPQKKPPEPPKPKEDLRPAFSAPRAPNQDKLQTEKTQPKTSVPKAPQPPSEGQPQPKPQVAQPKQAAPAQAKEDAAAKEEDKSKPDAEALDKAKQKVAKEAKTKAAKAAPKRKEKMADLMASLAGSSTLPELSFAKPTPKSKVYGGTEDVRWMSTVEGMIESKVSQLPRTAHWQAGGQVLICFHVDESGRITVKDLCRRSGYPDVDALAMRALTAAGPFPPPPPGVEHGLVWSSVWDGQLPSVHVSKR